MIPIWFMASFVEQSFDPWLQIKYNNATVTVMPLNRFKQKMYHPCDLSEN